jgi:hypothetical protein
MDSKNITPIFAITKFKSYEQDVKNELRYSSKSKE